MDPARPGHPTQPTRTLAEPDPREREDWFRRLPPAVQAQTRAKWQAQQQPGGPHAERYRRFRTRSILEGLVLLVLVQGLFGSSRWSMLLPAAALGAGLGYVWYLLRAGRALCLVTAGVCWTVLLVFDPLGSVIAVKSVVVLGALAIALGVSRESWYRSDAIGW